MKFADMTDAELLEIRQASYNACFGPSDCWSTSDLSNLASSRHELVKRGYQIMWVRGKPVFVPPPPEALGL